ncbi:MAG: hypothetical protein JO217_11440 [Acidobacteriaceae bacterium]|nr:hypothetical protein [Acidobacteriaceae bacterium]MBV9443299.1 hypothetical protein [Acidobacteriaceae bacterium]
MACRVATTTDPIDAVQWNSLGQPASPSNAPNLSTDAAHEQIASLRARVAELERTRPSEVAAARQAGLSEGMQQGRNQAAVELKAAEERIAKTLAELAGVKRKLRNEAELELLKLSLTVARRILHRELATDPEALHGLVHTALQKLQNREISRVRVYPAGADAVKTSLERIGAAPAIQVFPDPQLKNGDIIFETSFGELDASVDSQLAEIQRGFADRLSLR